MGSVGDPILTSLQEFRGRLGRDGGHIPFWSLRSFWSFTSFHTRRGILLRPSRCRRVDRCRAPEFGVRWRGQASDSLCRVGLRPFLIGRWVMKLNVMAALAVGLLLAADSKEDAAKKELE